MSEVWQFVMGQLNAQIQRNIIDIEMERGGVIPLSERQGDTVGTD